MPELEHIGLSLRHAWPHLRAIPKWPALREFCFTGNVLAVGDIEALPKVEFAQITKWVGNETPLRDLRRFPLMPNLKRLILQDTSSLVGIERHPTLLNLEIGGDFRDLSPLLALPQL